MSASTPAIPSPTGQSALVRRLCLPTSLILFFFVSTHLLNHALGKISLAAMDLGRKWFLAFWRSIIAKVESLALGAAAARPA